PQPPTETPTIVPTQAQRSPLPLQFKKVTSQEGDGARVMSVKLTVHIDYDADLLAGPEEGIEGVPVNVYELSSGELLAYGFTGEDGSLYLGPLVVNGTARLSIPFLGLSKELTQSDNSFVISIVPRSLPRVSP
ncbi:MAG: hypothetical protein ABFQ89_05555, partial [Chloroflexota bacterium]